jgi:hypothetical protein
MSHEGLSAIEEDILETYDQQLRDLANRAASQVSSLQQGQAVEDELAELVAELPAAMRTELVRRFREMVRAHQEARGTFNQLTTLQQQQMEMLKAHERHYIAHLLSDTSLEKIRTLLLNNPALMKQILGMGQELFKKGVFAGRAPDAAQMDNLTTQTPRNTDTTKDTTRGR